MLNLHEFNEVLPDKMLANFFCYSGDTMIEESVVLGEVAQALLDTGIQLTNKNLIIYLVKALECAEDVVQADIIRKTLEIVVSYTSDDC